MSIIYDFYFFLWIAADVKAIYPLRLQLIHPHSQGCIVLVLLFTSFVVKGIMQ